VRDFAVEVGQLLADRKCDDIRVFDVAGLSQVCDYIVIASGTSDRQMKSVGAEVADLGDERDMSAFRRDADAAHTWVLIDCVHVVVHLFEPNQRLYYDLESLWSDAKPIDWRRADQKKTHRHDGEIGLGAADDEENA
jgi:ribosome-associated protein